MSVEEGGAGSRVGGGRGEEPVSGVESNQFLSLSLSALDLAIPSSSCPSFLTQGERDKRRRLRRVKEKKATARVGSSGERQHDEQKATAAPWESKR